MLTFTVNALFESVSFSRPENAYKTNREVADYLKVTERTIYRLAGAKKILLSKLGDVGGFPKWKYTFGSSSNSRLPISASNRPGR